MLKIYFTLFILVSIGFVYGQQDLNNFVPLTAVGDIPPDFYVRTAEKVQEDMKVRKEKLTNSQQKVFLNGIHYGVDEILQSGLVIYGDEISNYVTKVAHKVLEKEPDLKKSLRFYTVKSNVSNAFSTDQGIVFVTTGLISQISSEAQLAYILAHEISHYIEKHVVEGFEFRTRNRGLNSQILQLSQYSKEKEFEADSLGVSLFKKAGYSRQYITSTFDVLMYSYLPIDEIPFPNNYYNTENCFIPVSKFADEKYEIKADEDYDDSKSSHPNIRKRKKQANEVADKLKGWGTTDSYFGIEEFKYIRNLARFERLRSDIIELEFGNALYTIFILEKEFPESLYLHRMKAQCWLGLSVMKQGNKINQTVEARSDLEGEGAGMHVFLKNLRKNEMASLAVRVVEDCRKKFPNDPEINEICQRTKKAFLKIDRLEFDKYRSYNFEEAHRLIKADSAGKVSAVISDSIDDAKLSKYERIKRKRTSDVAGNSIDSLDFYFYILPDLVKDKDFLAQYDEVKDENEREKEKEQAYNNMTRSQKKKYTKEQDLAENRIDLSSFILVDPAVISYKKGKVDHNGSAKMEDRVIDGFEFVAEKLDLDMTTVGKGNLDRIGTKGFNQKSFFTTMLIQIANANGEDIFPVDYSKINDLKKDLNSNTLVFSVVEHSYRPKFDPAALWLIFTGPGALAYLPIPFIKGNETELNLVIVDLEKAQIVSGAYYYYQEPLNQYSIESRLYDIFIQKNTKK